MPSTSFGRWPWAQDVALGDKVLVLGGGNSAMDAARTALRLGSKSVTVVYRRAREQMPANPWEVDEAEEEGVEFHFLAAPVRCDGDVCVESLSCQPMELGPPDESGRRSPVPIDCAPFVLEADTIIAAVGQQPDFDPFADPAITRQQVGLPGDRPAHVHDHQTWGVRWWRRCDRRRLGDRCHLRGQDRRQADRPLPARASRWQRKRERGSGAWPSTLGRRTAGTRWPPVRTRDCARPCPCWLPRCASAASRTTSWGSRTRRLMPKPNDACVAIGPCCWQRNRSRPEHGRGGPA